MAEFLTDAEIANLLAESKPIPDALVAASLPLHTTKIGHKEAECDISGAAGHDFRVIIRLSNQNALDFSVILAYLPKTTNRAFRLRRYNGKSHQHTNRLEKESFYGFHVHMATERYQREGEKEDSYAEPSDRYADLRSAIDCLIADCGFQRSSDQPPRLL